MDHFLPPQLEPPDLQQDIPARFRYVASRLPGEPAVEDTSGTLSYAQLDARSDHLAACLADEFGLNPEPVAVLLPGGALSAAAMLGTLKAGKFYAPLDPQNTPAVLEKYLQTSSARILLTSRHLLPEAHACAADGIRVIPIDELELDQAAQPPSPALTPDCYASLSFTSGSTDQPKAVIWHHAGWLQRSQQGVLYEHIHPGDRVGQIFSPGFSLYSTLIFITLLNGATLVERPAGMEGLLELLDWVNRQTVSVFMPPVSLLRQVLAADQHQRKIPGVLLFQLGGQNLYNRDLASLPTMLAPGCVVTNRLSMSELHLVARGEVRLDELGDGNDPVPVGYACAGNQISLLDEDGAPVAPGQVGQITVRSRYLSPGYWRSPELTAARFLPDPEGGDQRILLTGDLGRLRPDGRLEYCGRVDYKLKIRGHSIEPEAVETVLLSHPGVRECVVAARQGQDGEPRLVAYLAPRQPPAPTSSELRALIKRSLPEYMIPARFVTLENLPRNLNGKIERRALPAPGRARPALAAPFVPPRTELQAQLAGLWGELLELDEIGVEDNFYELGGDSLSALSLSLQVEALFGQALPAAYFRDPSISSLERLLQDQDLADSMAARSTASPRRGPPAVYSLRDRRHEKLQGNRQERTHRLVVRLAGGGVRGAYRLLTEVGLGLSFYTTCARLMDTLCRQEWFARRWEKVTRTHRQFLALNAQAYSELAQFTPGLDQKREVQHALMTTLWWSTWGRQLIVLSQDDFSAVCRVTGLERLQQAMAKGHGVICVYSHMLFIPAFWRWLEYQDLPPGVKLLPRKWKAAGQPGMAVENVQILAAARQALSQGGLVHILPDGGAGQRPLLLPFFNRTRAFQPGFAELALLTGAEVLPVTVNLDPQGRLEFTIEALFERDGGNPQAQVRRLVEQFAAHLTRVWLTQPAGIGSNHLEKYLDPPASEPGGESPDQTRHPKETS